MKHVWLYLKEQTYEASEVIAVFDHKPLKKELTKTNDYFRSYRVLKVKVNQISDELTY